MDINGIPLYTSILKRCNGVKPILKNKPKKNGTHIKIIKKFLKRYNLLKRE